MVWPANKSATGTGAAEITRFAFPNLWWFFIFCA
jgi:hypothetical protein